MRMGWSGMILDQANAGTSHTPPNSNVGRKAEAQGYILCTFKRSTFLYTYFILSYKAQ